MRRSRWALAALAATTLTMTMAAPAAGAENSRARTIPVQLLAINDLHGNLEPPSGSSGTVTTAIDANGVATTVPAGGAAYLATHLKNATAGHPNSLTVAGGDLIGGSPLLSAAFHDEPTILALKQMGLSDSSVGNHEFDEGSAELKRINYGGCRADDGCYDPAQPYRGGKFYLAANVLETKTHLPVLPPVSVRNVGGAKIGFIGMTLEGTPELVTAAGVAGLKFLDEIKTANGYAKLLRIAGVEAIVVLVHEGGMPASQVYNYDCGANGAGLTGPVADIAKGLDPSIDLVVTAHTHQSYVCNIPDPAGKPRLVTQAGSFGRLYTDIEASYDKRTRDFVRTSITAKNVIVTRDVTPDPTVAGIITKYQTLLGPIASRPVGYISETILGRGGSTPERPLGDLIADSQLAATSSAATGGAQIALMNTGGIRADLAYPDGVVTYGEAFAVQPFNNVLVTMDLTGAQLLTVLQQQFTGANAASPKYLQISSNLHWTADLSQTGAARVVADSVTINGAPLSLTTTYRVTVNNFLAGGGDGYLELANGTNPLVGELDIDAFVAYLTANSTPSSPLAAPPLNRITFL